MDKPDCSGKSGLSSPAEMEASRLGSQCGHFDCFGLLAQERRLRLLTKPQPQLPRVKCDRERVLQVLSNLVANAANVTAPGGTIELAVSAAERAVVFVVADTGPGLSQDDLARIFDRYWRGDAPAYKGSGPGLAIVRGLIEAPGGRVWAESEPGRGSRFCFTLPLANG
jgi:signal transduction histidine kinase